MISLSGVLDSARHQDGFQYLYTGASSIDLINFGGNLSLELLRLGHSWQETLRGVKLKSLVVLLGAGYYAFMKYTNRCVLESEGNRCF